MNCVRIVDTLRLGALALLWGGSFLFMRVAAPVVGPAWVAFGRSAIAALCLIAYTQATRHPLQLRTYWRQYLVLGIFQSAVPFFLFAAAETALSASLGAIINATTPVFGLVIGIAIGDEKLRWDTALGIILGLIGVGVVVGLQAQSIGASPWIPVLMGLGAACSYGISSNYTRRSVRGAPALGMATGSQSFAALLLTPLLFVYAPTQTVTTGAIVALVLLGLLSTGIAYMLFFRLVIDIGPVNASTVTFLVPLTALIWGVVLLNEQVDLVQIVGSVVVLLGTALTTGVMRRARA
jgi:drug/metabolite transporter (DMT)-like permease